MQVISQKLKEKKLKLTPQRLAIFELLYNTDSHPSAENIYKSLSATHPSMSLATIYKTLDSLKKANLVQEINVGEDSFRYDANCNFHIHLVCKCCNKVFDLPITPSIENINAEIVKQTGFNIEHEQMFFYGVCSSCSEKKDSE